MQKYGCTKTYINSSFSIQEVPQFCYELMNPNRHSEMMVTYRHKQCIEKSLLMPNY